MTTRMEAFYDAHLSEKMTRRVCPVCSRVRTMVRGADACGFCLSGLGAPELRNGHGPRKPRSRQRRIPLPSLLRKREDLGVSRDLLLDQVKIHADTLRRYENDGKAAPEGTALAIAQALCVDLREIAL